MKRALFVSNGHGEIAIAARIAQDLPAGIAADHLALVGGVHGAHDAGAPAMREVGPRRAMPSGGLIAMGNVRNIARDVAGGLVAHTLAQLRFLRGIQGTYDVAVAVGDIFALIMTLRARARATVYVGTAKSVHVAPYGPFEQRLLRKADAVFVRDAATAQHLQQSGIAAHAANVIVDLYAPPADSAGLNEGFSPYLALFPGSREPAYHDAVDLCAIVRELAQSRPHAGAVVSIAPALSSERMMQALAADAWEVRAGADEHRPFSLHAGGREIVRAWRGPLGAMLQHADAVLGQAGTANEGAAALGIPVLALDRSGKRAWYRKRQIGLLGDALAILPGNAPDAARELDALLGDTARRARMGAAGRARMGPAGGARAVAGEIARLCA